MSARHILLTAAAVPLLMGGGVPAAGEEAVPEELMGVWHKAVTLYEPLKTQQAQAGPSWQPLEFRMEVHADGRVTGGLGGARLVDCRMEINRSILGRKLQIKTDWIVKGGALQGPLFPGDTDTLRHFTIPFDVDGNCVAHGAMMQVFPIRYPLPLFDLDGMERMAGVTH